MTDPHDFQGEVRFEELDEEYVKRIIGLENRDEENQNGASDKVFVFKTSVLGDGRQIEFTLLNYAVVGRDKCHRFYIDSKDVSAGGNCILFAEENHAKIEALAPITINGKKFTKDDGWIQLNHNDVIYLTHKEGSNVVLNDWSIVFQMQSERHVTMLSQTTSQENDLGLASLNEKTRNEATLAISKHIFRVPDAKQQPLNVTKFPMSSSRQNEMDRNSVESESSKTKSLGQGNASNSRHNFRQQHTEVKLQNAAKSLTNFTNPEQNVVGLETANEKSRKATTLPTNEHVFRATNSKSQVVNVEKVPINSSRHNEMHQNFVQSETLKVKSVNEPKAGSSANVSRQSHKKVQVENTVKSSADLSVEEKMKASLENDFKLNSFIGMQEAVIKSSYEDKNIYMAAPTAAGKSLCFQLPAVISGKVTLVLSPLLALIEDMTNHLKKLAIPFLAFSKLQNRHPKDAFRTLFEKDNKVRLVFVTPEMCQTFTKLMQFLGTLHKSGKLGRLAIDESHCLVEQRQSFRKAYDWVKDFRIAFPTIPVSCFSATLNKRAIEELQNFLLLKDPVVFKYPTVDQPNVYYEVCHKSELFLYDIRNKIIGNGKPKTIVFCLTQNDCKEYAELFKDSHKIDEMKVQLFHAHISPQEKSRIFDEWRDDKINIIFTTTAFSMGINDENVSLIILTFAAFSMSCVYQCFGRGGRKQQKTECVMYVSDIVQEKNTVEDVLKSSMNDASNWFQQQAYERLDELLDCVYEKIECRREMFLNYFDDTFKGGCAARNAIQCDCCRNASKNHPRQDVLPEMKHLLQVVGRMEQLCTTDRLRNAIEDETNSNYWEFQIPWRKILRVMLQQQFLASDVITIEGTGSTTDIYATAEVHTYLTVGPIRLPHQFELQIDGSDPPLINICRDSMSTVACASSDVPQAEARGETERRLFNLTSHTGRTDIPPTNDRIYIDFQKQQNIRCQLCNYNSRSLGASNSYLHQRRRFNRHMKGKHQSGMNKSVKWIQVYLDTNGAERNDYQCYRCGELISDKSFIHHFALKCQEMTNAEVFAPWNNKMRQEIQYYCEFVNNIILPEEFLKIHYPDVSYDEFKNKVENHDTIKKLNIVKFLNWNTTPENGNNNCPKVYGYTTLNAKKFYCGSMSQLTLYTRCIKQQRSSDIEMQKYGGNVIVQTGSYKYCVFATLQNVHSKFSRLLLARFEVAVTNVLRALPNAIMINKKYNSLRNILDANDFFLCYEFLSHTNQFPIYGNNEFAIDRKTKQLRCSDLLQTKNEPDLYGNLKHKIENNFLVKKLKIMDHFHWLEKSDVQKGLMRIYIDSLHIKKSMLGKL